MTPVESGAASDLLSATIEDLADLVLEAAEALTGLCRRTPFVEARFGDVPVQLKLENLQHTGSFKYRGALATLRAAQAAGPVSSCVTYSAGNHGRALARAARAAGVPATVLMPSFAEPAKVALVEAEGASALLVEGDLLAATAQELVERTGALFVHPFDQLSIMAGQGTVGLEILEQHTEAARTSAGREAEGAASTADEDRPLDVLLVPVGGGGLVSGIAAIAARLSPETRVIPVEPERAGDLHESLAEGQIVPWDRTVTATTIADGLRAPAVGEHPWSIIHGRIHESLTVSEASILAAMRVIAAETNTIVEPSGAVAAAAVLQHPARFKGLSVAAVVSGGNIAPARFAEMLAEG